MRKWAFALAAALLFVIAVAEPASAKNCVQSGAPKLTIVGTTAYCFATYEGNLPSDTVSITLTLKRGNNTIATWSATGTKMARISETCAVQTGKTYTLVLSPSINGIAQPSISVTARSN